MDFPREAVHFIGRNHENPFFPVPRVYAPHAAYPGNREIPKQISQYKRQQA